MLKLRDFFHLPELDQTYRQVVQADKGLILIAGLDAHTSANPGSGSTLLPSGRATIFDILAGDILEEQRSWQGVVLPAPRTWGSAGRSGMTRPPRHLKRRIRELPGETGAEIPAAVLLEASHGQPTLLMVERLSTENVRAVLAAAQQMLVLAQMDSVLAGGMAARQLLDLGAGMDELEGLAWVLTVQRLPALCGFCAPPRQPGAEQLQRITALYPRLADLAECLILEAQSERAARLLNGKAPAFRSLGSCERCSSSGRSGDGVTVFDVFRCEGRGPEALDRASLLSQEEYLLRLAALGRLPLDDLLYLEQSRTQHIYRALTSQEQALGEANASVTRKLAELEAANRVLVQRTEVLVSLQEMSQALTGSLDLHDLANKVCRRAAELCSADRIVLFFYSGEDGEQAEMLASTGWPEHRLNRRVEAGLVRQINPGRDPAAFNRLPPGVSMFDPGQRSPADQMLTLTGLSVPLLAQNAPVGMMVVQTTRRAGFLPREVALLQTFANQAAMAFQRAGLVEMLRRKIAQLEEAQAALLKKERLEHELDLARSVQQSMLPKEFPRLEGFRFAALNRPARQVGGDFYDAFPLDEGRFGLFIGDVSDKGMPAALYMALTRSLLRAEARRAASPAQVLRDVNRLLLGLGEQQLFVSVFYGVVEMQAKFLTYARAGHDYPLLLRSGQIQRLGGKGMVLGMMDPDELELLEETVQLEPGDRLLLYTDGLTDVISPAGKFFDLKRLEALVQSQAGLELEAMGEAIFRGLDQYQDGAEQFDDMTLLGIEVQP
jgi:phosphoserine phosphatase RsbU/P